MCGSNEEMESSLTMSTEKLHQESLPVSRGGGGGEGGGGSAPVTG